MINGYYATTPQEVTFQASPIDYIQDEMVTVGKGKNKRRIKQAVTHRIDYKLVTYDVSIAPKVILEHEQELSPVEKRLNWLVLANREAIIWEKQLFKPYDRKYPVRRDGTRKDGLVSIKEPFSKWVPSLRPSERKSQKITRIVAGQ